MLQLYIDGHRINLSEDTRTEFYRRNPFFTNDGDFTFDIDIDLNDPTNAQVYYQAGRLDRVRRVSHRKAVMMDDTTIIISGTEVVLQVDDNHAKIQIVAGSSALNFAMSDTRLKELDLHKAFAAGDGESVMFPVCQYNVSPHADYGLMDADKFVETDEGTKMNWSLVDDPIDPFGTGVLTPNGTNRFPYMWAVVERVLNAIGFGIRSNVIHSDSRYSRMVMVSTIGTSLGAMLPDWSVKEFFDEIQKFFNVVLVVRPMTNEVSIVNAYEYFDQGMVEIPYDDILSIHKEYGKESDMTMVDYTAVHYAFPDRLLNKYAAIPDSVTKTATVISSQPVDGGRPYDANYYAGIWKAITGNEDFLYQSAVPTSVKSAFTYRRIYRQWMTQGRDYRDFVLWAAEDDYCALKMVNQFAGKESTRSDVTDVELKIVPVRMVSGPAFERNGAWYQIPVPAIDGESSLLNPDTGQWDVAHSDFNDDIAGSTKDPQKNLADNIFVAFYFPEVPIDWEDPNNNVPSGMKISLASPDYEVQLHRVRTQPFVSNFWMCSRHLVLGTQQLTMAIKGANGMDAYTYSRNPSIDTSIAYTIQFRSNQLPDVRQIFLIDNRKFYCKELKYDISAGRRSEIVEGIFFPVIRPNSAESGEPIYDVSYSLLRVVLDSKVETVAKGESLDLVLRPSNASYVSGAISLTITMGGDDITDTSYTRSGLNVNIHIPSVTGNVEIDAEFTIS